MKRTAFIFHAWGLNSPGIFDTGTAMHQSWNSNIENPTPNLKSLLFWAKNIWYKSKSKLKTNVKQKKQYFCKMRLRSCTVKSTFVSASQCTTFTAPCFDASCKGDLPVPSSACNFAPKNKIKIDDFAKLPIPKIRMFYDRRSQDFWLGAPNQKSHAMTSSETSKENFFVGTKIS